MKKLVLVCLAAITLMGSVFAKDYVIDLSSSEKSSKVSIVTNPYGEFFEATRETVPTFTKQFAKLGKLQKGDTVQVNYKMTPSIDVDTLQCVLCDNSEAANWWMELGAPWTEIHDLKKGQVSEGSIKFDVINTPKKEVVLVIQSKDNKTLTLTLNK